MSAPFSLIMDMNLLACQYRLADSLLQRHQLMNEKPIKGLLPAKLNGIGLRSRTSTYVPVAGPYCVDEVEHDEAGKDLG